MLSKQVERLENLFDTFNKKLFNGELIKPIITISPDNKGTILGWCTSWKAWNNERFEINVCAEHLNRSIDEICGTLVHEMVHLYCIQKGIKDTSNKGIYHNKNYKTEGEAHGLIVEKGKYGYHVTKLNDEMKEFVKGLNLEPFAYSRIAPVKMKSLNRTIKWVCPHCGAIVRSTKEVAIKCLNCGVDFEREDQK